MEESRFKIKDFGDKPFFRLTGGKQNVLDILIKHLPKDWEELRYIEPFFGAGSLYFKTKPKNALLNDANKLLIDTYKSIRDNPTRVYKELEKISETHSEETYYKSRTEFNKSPLSAKKAAQFIYMNRSCYNGVMRVNKKQEFNVPWGKKKRVLIPSNDNLKSISNQLMSTTLTNLDFATVLENAGCNDFIYMDPPYVELKNQTSNFSHFTWPKFSLEDHKRLADISEELTQKGAKVMISNSDQDEVRNMFKGWNISYFDIPRYTTTKKQGPGSIPRARELIITNY